LRADALNADCTGDAGFYRLSDKAFYQFWMMICVGENSGNTSRLLRVMLYEPYSTTSMAKPIMTPLKRIEKRTKADIMMA